MAYFVLSPTLRLSEPFVMSLKLDLRAIRNEVYAGRSVKHVWPPSVRYSRAELTRYRPAAKTVPDLIATWDAMLLVTQPFKTLLETFDASLEFLPAKLEHPTRDEEVAAWFVNVLRSGLTIDLKRSRAKAHPQSPTLLWWLEKTVLLETVQEPLVRVPENSQFILVRADVKAAAKALQLTGLRFRPLRTYEGDGAELGAMKTKLF